MDFRQLRNLAHVVRYASFGVAAEKLHVTQPALSKSIRALEQSVGVRLLDRGPWGVRPTDYGERLVAYAEAMLRLSDEARSEIESMRGLQRGHLRIGSMTTMVSTVLPLAARRFLAEHPGVQLSLNEELSPALQTQLLSGAIDLALMSRPRDFPDEELEFRELVHVPINIVADRDNPLAARTRLGLEDLVDCGWILPARPDPDRTALDRLFSTARLPLPRAICETTSSTFQVTMQAGSPWLSYLSASSSFLRNPQSRLVPLALDGPIWIRSIGVAQRRYRVRRPLIESFVRDLEAVLARSGPDTPTMPAPAFSTPRSTTGSDPN